MKLKYISLIFLFFSIPLFAQAESKKIKIEGMTCIACAAQIEREFKKYEEIKSINIKFRAQKIEFEFKEDQKLSDEDIEATISKLGYKFIEVIE